MSSNAVSLLEGEEVVKVEPEHLFKAMGVRNPEFWQCIRYIAPNGENKKWKSTDAIGVYCTKCKVTVNYNSVTNSKGVKRHMEKNHMSLVEEYYEKNGKKRKSIVSSACNVGLMQKTDSSDHTTDQYHVSKAAKVSDEDALVEFNGKQYAQVQGLMNGVPMVYVLELKSLKAALGLAEV